MTMQQTANDTDKMEDVEMESAVTQQKIEGQRRMMMMIPPIKRGELHGNQSSTMKGT